MVRQKEPPNISDVTTPIIYEYEKKIQKKKKLINELIDYYFDSEEDQDFIEDNRLDNTQ